MLSLPTSHLLACATCNVDRASITFMAQQSAVVFMLAMVFAMLGTILLIIFNYARKARRAAAAEAAASQL